jgi:Family of unknown function (DUF6314)
MTSATVFAALTGQWRIERRIDPGLGTFTGVARIRPLRTDELHYREDGELRLATGHSGPAHREYVYILDGDAIRVCLVVDGEPGTTVHRLDLAGGSEASDVHLCRADRYLGTYSFAGADRFTVAMRVVGPDKDYEIHTSYRRALEG